MERVFLLIAILIVATVLGVVWRTRSGRPTAPRTDRPPIEADLLSSLGVNGNRVTLLQFSSAFCAPCRATRRILEQVAATVPGVTHVDVDAESHLDAVRALGVVRTPTTLLVDGTGRVRNRVVGQPRRDDVLAAVAAVTGDSAVTGDA
jgi:thiol-disulfide isomerase/thioredoxin